MKRYDSCFKEQAFRLVLEQGRGVTSIAKDIGVHDNTVYKQINQYKEHKDHAFQWGKAE